MDIQISEIKKCKEDITYFFTKYVMLCTKDHKFDRPYYYPKMGEVLTFINNNVSGDILAVDSDRQIGGTTMLMVGMLHQLIFNPNITIGYIGYQTGMLEYSNNILKQLYNALPRWVCPNVRNWTNYRIEFDNNCRALFTTNVDSLRGKHINLLLVDNARYNKHLKSIYSCFPTGHATKIVLMDYGSSILLPTDAKHIQIDYQDLSYQCDKSHQV
jgi:hypothetical protein